MAQKLEPTQLNEDQEDLLMSYLNSDYMSAPCWNPPTPSSTPTDQSPVSTPICQTFFDISHWNHTGESLINEYPFIITENHPPYFHQPTSPPSSLCSSDTEPTRKRRGRKKRDSCTSPLPPTMIAPAPVVKQLPVILSAQEDRKKYGNVNKCVPLSVADDNQKAATIAKRQERLIKNRAAALLSRKRKREHLTALEDQRNGLSNENSELKQRVLDLEKENLELKKKLEIQGGDSKSVMIFMMILFSFAYLVSMATKLVPLKYNTTTTTKLPFTKTHDESITFQLTNYSQRNSIFKKNQKHSSLKRRRFERIVA